MTCIPGHTLVETWVGDAIELCFAKHLRVGDTIRARPSTHITYIFSQHIGGPWPLFSYMGLDADAEQWIRLPDGAWERIANVGTYSMHFCEALYGFMLADHRIMYAGGVECCVHYYGDPHWPFLLSSSPSSSDVSGEETTGVGRNNTMIIDEIRRNGLTM